jgi:hypothetical protein
LVAARLNLSLIPSQGSENSLNMERFVKLVPGPYRMFLRTSPKVPGAGCEKAAGLNHSLRQPFVGPEPASHFADRFAGFGLTPRTQLGKDEPAS